MLKGTLPGLVAFQPIWHAFLSNHEQWFKSRLLEESNVYFVPIRHSDGFSCTFSLSPNEVAAESDFATVCRDFKIVGVRVRSKNKVRLDAELIHYKGVQPSDPTPDTAWQELGRNLGWTDEMVANAKLGLRKADDLQLRVTSAAGRLLCNPEFLKEREKLRTMWAAVPEDEQLPLPMRPSVRVAGQPTLTARWEPSGQTAEFIDSFENFCNKWEISGCETWDLPIPRGPFWPDLRLLNPAGSCQAAMRFETPWHFAALDSDGLGEMAMEQLRAEQQRHGMNDQSSWWSYAQLFRLGFWESVLRRRYTDRRRPRDFVRQTESLLADLLEVSLERIEKFRKLHNALRSGRLRSLAGVR
jgi:hypothetical protein